ncbi:RTX-I toxin determinant A from serotypes 1/9 [Trichinella pseudospiralis]
MRLSRLCGKEHESRNAIATTTTITDCQTHSQLALKTSLEKRQVALEVFLGGANDKIFLTKQSKSCQQITPASFAMPSYLENPPNQLQTSY